MTCDKCLEVIALLHERDVEDGPLGSEVRLHVGQCGACAAEARRIEMLHDRLQRAGTLHRNAALADAVMRRIATRTQRARRWRTARIAAGFVAMLGAVMAGALLWPGGNGGANAALAALVEHVRNAESLSFTMTSQGNHESQHMQGFMLGQHALRFELPEHRVIISDGSRKQSLMLITDKRQAIRNPTLELQPIDFRGILLGLLPSVIEIVGAEVIDGIDTLVIRAPWPEELGSQEKWTLTASIDVHTGVPIQVEAIWGNQGDDDWRRTLFSNIVFDAPLDPALFSLEVPQGYALMPESDDPHMAALTTGRTMVNILMACMIHHQEHDGRWPARLQDLDRYGITAEVLKNPRYPGLDVGYVYRPPAPDALWDRTLVLWEIPDEWGAGINVGFADTHVEFISDRAEFEAMIRNSP